MDAISTKITDEDNAYLLKTFTREEIEVVLKSMHPTKAPGPDGYQAVFYQKYWNIVGSDTVSLCNNFLNGNMDLGLLNKTCIVLIPKKKDPMRMKDFGPISLGNVVYKLIDKVLVNKLKNVTDKLISPTQSAFVPRRSITDNAMIRFESIHALNNKRTGKKGVVAMKLDMSKAYNRVEWNYLRRVIMKMGFDSGQFSSLRINKHCPSISHLFFFLLMIA